MVVQKADEATPSGQTYLLPASPKWQPTSLLRQLGDQFDEVSTRRIAAGRVGNRLTWQLLTAATLGMATALTCVAAAEKVAHRGTLTVGLRSFAVAPATQPVHQERGALPLQYFFAGLRGVSRVCSQGTGSAVRLSSDRTSTDQRTNPAQRSVHN